MEVKEIPKIPGIIKGVELVGVKLENFHMWTRKITEYKNGQKQMRTVRVNLLREAAFHYWKDSWVPIDPISEEFLRSMEQALRTHPGLHLQNVQFPDGGFLEMPQALPENLLMPGVEIDSTPVGELSPEAIEAMKASRPSGLIIPEGRK